MASALRRELV
ncbi:hypothetical protein F383_02056 [Gossypium arboreum]|uniref:Uncharacterized protein n=1 Tax=Gossypium arboreum TaxID=29729 RepID=A0A0B0PEF5_GOSAR|nr:hypothetical protein F383_02056 [Gossypium arboreum]